MEFLVDPIVIPFQDNNIPMIRVLLDSGALLCSQDKSGLTPLQILKTKKINLDVMKYISLKCLAVKTIKDNNLFVNPEEVGHDCATLYNLHA